jgi:hypothetical protein
MWLVPYILDTTNPLVAFILYQDLEGTTIANCLVKLGILLCFCLLEEWYERGGPIPLRVPVRPRTTPQTHRKWAVPL